MEYENGAGEYRLLALALTWRKPPAAPGNGERPICLPRHWMGRGVTPVGFHRSAWDDPDATYVAIKGGSPASAHAHMDAGVFILEAGGVRWAVDLGMQDYYSLEKLGLNLWEHPVRQESDRWKPFRMNSQGHSVPSFNGAQQRVRADAPIVRFVSEGDMPHTVVDLSAIYADQVAEMLRVVALLADGQVILQDRWTSGERPVEMRWQMLTFAEVSLEDGKIILRQDGRRFELRVLEPGSGVAMEVVDQSEPVHSFDVPNPGLRMIILTCRTEPGQTRTLRIAAALSGVASAEIPPSIPTGR